EDAIEDGLGEVLVVEDAAPGLQRLVRGEEHGALPTVAIVDHVEQDVGGVGAVGEVADLVDDEDVGMGVGRQGISESALRLAADRSLMSSAAVVKKASKPFW